MSGHTDEMEVIGTCYNEPNVCKLYINVKWNVDVNLGSSINVGKI